jgi:uncharacterized membrane protein
MTISKLSTIVVLLSAVLAAGLTDSSDLRAQQPARWVVPPGFQVAVFAENVENAREMALGSEGTVFVGSMRAGKVHAVIDRDGDHKAEALDRAHSGDDADGAHAREHRRKRRAIHVDRACRVE